VTLRDSLQFSDEERNIALDIARHVTPPRGVKHWLDVCD
jgi:hypothetical protein